MTWAQYNNYLAHLEEEATEPEDDAFEHEWKKAREILQERLKHGRKLN